MTTKKLVHLPGITIATENSTYVRYSGEFNYMDDVMAQHNYHQRERERESSTCSHFFPTMSFVL